MVVACETPECVGGLVASRLGPLRVAYGTPIELDDLRDRNTKEAAEIGTERLMAAIAELESAL